MNDALPDPLPAAGSGAGAPRKIALQNLVLPAVIVAMMVVTGAIEPRFWSSENLLNLSRQLAPLMILSVGQALAVIGGGLDLSLAAVLGLSGVYGIMAMRHVGVGGGIAAMLATGAAFGLANGLIITRFQVSPFIVTLGTLSIGRGLALMASAGLPLYDVPDRFIDGFGYGTLLGIPVPAVIAVATLLVGASLLRFTIFGRYLYAIGSSPAAAFSSGVPVSRYLILCYVLSGVTGSIGAVALTAWVNAAQPMAASGLELQSLAAVVVGGIALTGGAGSMINAFYGALILGMLANSLNMVGVSSFMQTLVIGVVIVVAVILDRLRRGKSFAV